MATQATKPYFEKLQTLKAQVANKTYQLVAELQSEITSLITERQLFDKGIDGQGNSLGQYAALTVVIKRSKGQIHDHITLRDTGEFYEGFYAIGKYEKLHIFSTDAKAEDLLEDYGPDIFVLTPDHANYVNNELLAPKLNEWLLKELTR